MLAEGFGIEVDALHEPGVRLVTDAPAFRGYPGIYVLRLGETAVVVSPPPGDRRDLDVTIVPLGPSIHSYLHRDDFVAGTASGRPLDAADGEAVAAFRAAVDDDAWHEGGFGEELPAETWLLVEGDEVLAMGNLTDFGGRPADVGLVTHPGRRGEGLATRLATAMLARCFETAEVARYRALATNAPSLAVARRLGFERYGENVAVRLTQSR